ncbi:MAG: VWA domain-containing protein [Acidobacteriota bacterium]|jgi:Ca-activated chloride channel family protein
MFQLADPWYLLLLALIPLLIWRYIRRIRQGQGSLRFSSNLVLEGIRSSWTLYARHILFGISMLSLGLAIIALARPQKGTESEEVLTEGIDIVMALDASSSMAAEDFKPQNRFHVAKLVAGRFIEELKHDRVGLVVFAAKAYSRCPLTLDYGVLLNVLNNAELGAIEDGTAIGNALATCLNRLRESKAKSRVVILLTDGINNRGEIQPIDAAEIARTLGIKIYTIGVGSTGTARVPVDHPVYGRVYTNMKVEIDEASLKKIAETTHGIYYRATDRPSLEKIFEDIGSLEKTEIEVKTYTHYNERYDDFLMPAMMLIFLSTLLAYTRFAKIP